MGIVAGASSNSPLARSSSGTKLAAERVEVYFDQDSGYDIVFRNAWCANYISRQRGSSWVLSNAAGGWELVTESDYRELQSVALSRSLFERLESKYIILTTANAPAYFESYRHWTTPHFRHPVHHIIVSTLRCNLSCLYCHADIVRPDAGTSFDLDLVTAEAILDFAIKSKAPTQSFEFQGGESLLNRDVLMRLIPLIIERYRSEQKQVYLSVQTNGTLLTDRWMEFFKQHGVKVGTSLDGPADVHDHQRRSIGGRGTHALVARKAQRYRLPVLPTATRQSVDNWREHVDYQLARGPSVNFHAVYPINAARRNWSDIGVSGSAYVMAYGQVIEYLRTLWRDNYYPLERRCRLAMMKLFVGQDVDFADFGNPCGMVHSQIVYHTNGDVYTCDEGRDFPEFKVGNVHCDSFDTVVFGHKTRQLKSLSLPHDQECLTCAYRPWCSTCPVYERAVTGELHARHAGTDHCAHTKLIYDTILKWYDEDPSSVRKAAAWNGISTV